MSEISSFTPFGAKVLIKRLKAEEKTAGGIILPDSAQEKPQKGEIISVGGDCKYAKAGQTVLFPKWGGTELEEGGESYIILKEEELLGSK